MPGRASMVFAHTVPGAGGAPPGPEALRAPPCAQKLKARTARSCAGGSAATGWRSAGRGAAAPARSRRLNCRHVLSIPVDRRECVLVSPAPARPAAEPQRVSAPRAARPHHHGIPVLSLGPSERFAWIDRLSLWDSVTRGYGDHSPLTTAAILEWRRRSAWGGALLRAEGCGERERDVCAGTDVYPGP